MDKIKVQDFCNAYSKAIGLSNETRIILIELMENIISKYEKVIPNIPASMDESSLSYFIKPINGSYSIEDFFLNRMMRNIWNVTEINQRMIDEGFADVHTKGEFDPSLQEVKFNRAKLKVQVEQFAKYFFTQDDYNKMKRSSEKKVIMHEFEHGLQTRYDNNLDMNIRDTYKKISNELAKMPQYKLLIQLYDDIPQQFRGFTRSSYLSTGSHVGSRLETKGNKTYRNINGFDNLNEILNETESLEMSNQQIYLFRTLGNNKNRFPLRNPESSNCNITNYGDLFKIIFGNQNTFTLMYLNPINAFQEFNKLYNDIFQQVYGSNKDAIELFINAITDIKKTNSEDSHIKLCITLARCLEKKIENFYNNGNITNNQMIDSIIQFERLCISNKDEKKRNTLEHIKILANLKSKINSRNISNTLNVSSKNEGNNFMLSIPSFEEIVKISSNYKIIYDNNNQIKVQNLTTSEIINDKNLEEIAIFCNLWFSSAGLKLNNDNGENYAFNDGSKALYDYFIKSVDYNLKNTGNIDSVSIFKNAENLSYKHSQEIITRLFMTDYQANFLDKFFRKRIYTDKPKTAKTETLINMFYASDLAYGEEPPEFADNGKSR